MTSTMATSENSDKRTSREHVQVWKETSEKPELSGMYFPGRSQEEAGNEKIKENTDGGSWYS